MKTTEKQLEKISKLTTEATEIINKNSTGVDDRIDKRIDSLKKIMNLCNMSSFNSKTYSELIDMGGCNCDTYITLLQSYINSVKFF